MSNRLDRVRDLLSEHNLDAILITSGTNRRYLTGFTAEDHAADELSAVGIVSAGHRRTCHGRRRRPLTASPCRNPGGTGRRPSRRSQATRAGSGSGSRTR